MSSTTAGVSRIFLDPSFDLSKPETFEAIFQLSATAGENFAEQVERSGRMIQERLSLQLDAVEVSITNQIAQKSHHFFQVRMVAWMMLFKAVTNGLIFRS